MNGFCFRALMLGLTHHWKIGLNYDYDQRMSHWGADSFGGVMCTAHPLLMVCLHCESETHSLLCKVESERENWFEIRERKESSESACKPNPILIFTSLPCPLPLRTWGCGGISTPYKMGHPFKSAICHNCLKTRCQWDVACFGMMDICI